MFSCWNVQETEEREVGRMSAEEGKAGKGSMVLHGGPISHWAHAKISLGNTDSLSITGKLNTITRRRSGPPSTGLAAA